MADDVGAQPVAHGRIVHEQRLGWARWRTAQSYEEDLVTYVIAQPCVDLKDRACVDECPVDCIYEGKRMLYIQPDECVDCGACEPVCPVEAIFYEDDTPEEWKSYYDANVHFFDEIGSPGGAAKMGEIDHDHEIVAALPPQEHDE
jgi:NAD-dependent dihydropyrimidine dehydrogenase PreA subunit